MPNRTFRRISGQQEPDSGPSHRVHAIATVHRRWLFNSSLATGFVVGLFFALFGRLVLHPNFASDGNKIWRIASGRVPDFTDQSFTPVALVYRSLGLGDSQTAAGLVGYLLASVVIVAALYRSGRNTASLITATYIVASFSLAGIYLGQYSKDVLVLIAVLLLLTLPRSIWWEFLAVAWMAVYAYYFRDYWWIVAIAYVVYRILIIHQARIRYLLTVGALASVGVGLSFFLMRDVDPNHYRTVVQPKLDDANTLIVPLVPFEQPTGGAVDVFLNYWLLFLPVLLPFTASIFYLAVTGGVFFAKTIPLMFARSSIRWPSRSTLDGALVRRSLALMLALATVQAVFEPDYGSSLRHFTPLMPLALALMQTMRSGKPRLGRSVPWSWSGVARQENPRA